jgi:hypothetical protein
MTSQTLKGKVVVMGAGAKNLGGLISRTFVVYLIAPLFFIVPPTRPGPQTNGAGEVRRSRSGLS